jgi:hypothetical protein
VRVTVKSDLLTLSDFRTAQADLEDGLASLPFKAQLARYDALKDLHLRWAKWWVVRAAEWQQDPTLPEELLEAAKVEAVNWHMRRADFWLQHGETMAKRR